MNRYLGFNGHRYGDLFISLTACRTLKRNDPGCHLTLVINGNYRNAAPLFLDQDCIDRIHVTHSPIGGFDAEDLKWIGEQRFTHVFDPMADHNHAVPWWWYRNQPQEMCLMHGLREHADETGKLSLHRWFEPTKDLHGFVALQAFAGSNEVNTKQLTPKRAQEIVDLIIARGYGVLQMGPFSEPQLHGTITIESDFFAAVKNLLGCRALITTDSGFSWAASCYDHPTLGLYSHAYYGKEHVGAIQPLNPNATYFDAANVNEIPLADIDAKLAQLL